MSLLFKTLCRQRKSYGLTFHSSMGSHRFQLLQILLEGYQKGKTLTYDFVHVDRLLYKLAFWAGPIFPVDVAGF